MNRNTLLLSLLLASGITANADRIAHFPMEAGSNEKITETVTGDSFLVNGRFAPENIPGAVGTALRFDGSTSFIKGTLAKHGTDADAAMTVSMWVAPQTYPVIEPDVPTDEKMSMASTLDENAHSGWAFRLGYTGKYSFDCYTGGWKVTIEASDVLPCYEWSHLVAVIDGDAKLATLYRNGVKVGETKCMATVNNASTKFVIGKSPEDAYLYNIFRYKTFNGLIDEIEVFDHALKADDFADAAPEHEADLAVPASRFAGDVMRPRYHGMPDAAWTNETHGMYYSNGRYHVFFQKNANGPYMTRLHWGHISSENLYDWREERIALMPGESYDVKGCWSGCVFADDEITGGKPNILYTGVDYAKAMISQAVPQDDDLIFWEKTDRNPVINGRPSGLGDDFRDPYFFRSDAGAFIIVGSSKNGMGTTTLHQYNPATGSWSNDGRTFFSATNPATEGVFWEMPNVTEMDNGQWLFTTTPLGTSQGVRTIYRTGSIDAGGMFVPSSNSPEPKLVELISKEGYGLLSPTIYRHDGKTIALGIVPDKLPGSENANLGWAHCYSLPREWSLDNNGNLVQKPFSGLAEMRSSTSFSKKDFSLDGTLSLNPVEGREAEILGVFTAGTVPFGFNFFKNGTSRASLTYSPSTGSLTVDFSNLRRTANDGGVYDGVYSCTLPEIPGKDDTVKINLFIDHSILDIFVNDKYATSIRVYPMDLGSDEIEAFAEGGSVAVQSLDAWTLTKENSGAGIQGATFPEAGNSLVTVADISGRIIKRCVDKSEATEGLENGLYLIAGKKVLVRN